MLIINDTYKEKQMRFTHGNSKYRRTQFIIFNVYVCTIDHKSYADDYEIIDGIWKEHLASISSTTSMIWILEIDFKLDKGVE